MNIHVTCSGTTSTSGTISTLYGFTGGTDGGHPQAGLIQGADSYLYGTTLSGSGNAGTIYKVPTTGGAPTILYTFTGASDGGNPYARSLN